MNLDLDPEGHEARRQQALLAALAAPGSAPTPPGLREPPARAARGLAAYRANAHALAERALAAACPTLQAMLGAEDFAQLAREFWHAHPPQRGDIGEWGGALPDWIEAHPSLHEWPWLADCARLDLALHRAERAADATLDADSLALLQSADPAALRLELRPGVAVLAARWPVATIHDAHRPDAPPQAFEAVREAIAEQRAETVLVARSGWRATLQRIDAPTAAWTLHLLEGVALEQALGQAGESFDFAGWLVRALQQGWLKGVALRGD